MNAFTKLICNAHKQVEGKVRKRKANSNSIVAKEKKKRQRKKECSDEIDLDDTDGEEEDEQLNTYELDDGFTVDDMSSKEAEERAERDIDAEFDAADADFEREEAEIKAKKQARKRRKREELKKELLEELMASKPELKQKSKTTRTTTEREKKAEKDETEKNTTRIGVAIVGPSDPKLALQQSMSLNLEKIQKALCMVTHWIAKKWQLPMEQVDIISGGLGSADYVAVELWRKPREKLGGLQRFDQFHFHLASPMVITPVLGQSLVLAQDSGQSDLLKNSGRTYNLTHTHLSKNLKRKTSQWPSSLLSDETVNDTDKTASLECHTSWDDRTHAILQHSIYRIVFLPAPTSPASPKSDPIWCRDISNEHVKIFYL